MNDIFKDNDTESEEYSLDEDLLSICNELEQLEKQLHSTHISLHNSINTLENIHNLVISSKNINVIHEGEKCNFNNILEKLHCLSLEKIKSSNATSNGEFSEALLKVIDEYEFC